MIFYLGGFIYDGEYKEAAKIVRDNGGTIIGSRLMPCDFSIINDRGNANMNDVGNISSKPLPYKDFLNIIDQYHNMKFIESL